MKKQFIIKRKYTKAFSILLGCFLINACTLEPDYKVPKSGIENYLEENKFQNNIWQDASPKDHIAKGSWWEIFEDEYLNSLIEKLNENNPNLKSAFYKMEQARLAARVTKSALFPQVGAEGGFSRDVTSANSYYSRSTVDAWTVGMGLTWDLDFFGRVRSMLSSDTATAQAMYGAYQNAMLYMQADLATTYFSLKQVNSEIEILENARDIRQKQLELEEQKFASDASTKVDVKRAEELLLEAKASIATSRLSKKQIENYIALLIGTTANKFVPENVNFSNITTLPKVPNILPSNLLERRPDIANYERLVFAANARIGAANAAFFPTVTITAATGLNSTAIDTLLNSSSFSWGVNPQIYLPVFQAGKLIAEKEIAQANYKQTVEDYKACVLKAIYEVENYLSATSLLEKEYFYRNQTTNAAKIVEELSLAQYNEGYIEYYVFTDAQRVSLLNQREELRVKASQFKNCVLLIASLGGSWQEAKQEISASEDKKVQNQNKDKKVKKINK